jgi:hypothetical protein
VTIKAASLANVAAVKALSSSWAGKLRPRSWEKFPIFQDNAPKPGLRPDLFDHDFSALWGLNTGRVARNRGRDGPPARKRPGVSTAKWFYNSGFVLRRYRRPAKCR